MGVPTLGCNCHVCTSSDPRDQRLRPSVAIEWHEEGAEGSPHRVLHRVLIDTGPDFRHQALRFGVQSVDAVFYTHAHADHIMGLDDLRPLSFSHGERKMPLYANTQTAEVLERVFAYTFSADATYPTRARVALHRLSGPVDVAGVTFTPVPLMHGRLEVTGYRFGNAAYLTDMNQLPEAIDWAQRIGARETWFTHMSHEVMHAEMDPRLPAGIRLAYDGLRVPVEL
jgi:phosphoribosyl 1,2-cyclic phosphate phosphodiesterase